MNQCFEDREAFFSIARCDVAISIIDGVILGPHPCRTIVESQKASPENFQLPEPWVGHIETAPLLFVASNPSIGEDKHALRSSPDDVVWDSHVNLFDDGAGYTEHGIYTFLPDGTRSPRWVPHWSFVKSQATSLLGHTAIAGKDFALTEVVHCKSRGELGVSECATYCADRHLQRVLDASGARLVIGMGSHAQRELRRHFRLSDETVYGSIGQHRQILFVPHSNFRGPRKLESVIPEHLDQVRAFLASIL